MGLYDHVYIDVSCPVCGNYIDKDFQTKDFECMLDSYKPGDNVGTHNRMRAIRVYTSCPHHYEIEKNDSGLIFTKNKGTWIEYEIPIIDGIIARDQNLWTLHTEPLEWNGLTVLPKNMTMEEFVLRVVSRNAKIAEDIRITKTFIKGKSK